MSGRGLGGKGLGKAGLGKSSLRRHRKISKDAIRGITKGDIRRLARRGGVKRISAEIYDHVRVALKDFVHQILQDAIILTDYRKTKTVTVQEIVLALRHRGRPIYGFSPTRKT